jgi:hypothetical protein
MIQLSHLQVKKITGEVISITDVPKAYALG